MAESMVRKVGLARGDAAAARHDARTGIAPAFDALAPAILTAPEPRRRSPTYIAKSPAPCKGNRALYSQLTGPAVVLTKPPFA